MKGKLKLPPEYIIRKCKTPEQVDHCFETYELTDLDMRTAYLLGVMNIEDAFDFPKDQPELYEHTKAVFVEGSWRIFDYEPPF